MKSDKCPLVVSFSLPENGRLQVGGELLKKFKYHRV